MKISEKDFIREFERIGPAALAAQIGVSHRGIYARRKTLENKLGRQLTAPDNGKNNRTRTGIAHPHRALLEINTGLVLIGSDAHYWPGNPSTKIGGGIERVDDPAK